MKKLTSLLLLAALLSGCCTLGPDDHPGGVGNYFKECLAFVKRDE